jgi:hypothetical protein
VTSQILTAGGVALVRPPAPWRDGMRDVAALNAANFKAAKPGHADGRKAQQRLPADVRQQLLDAIYRGRPFRTVLRELELANQVWGLTKTDEEWSTALEAALTASRRGDFQHGTNAAYVHGCVCSECRQHQQTRMGRNRG